MKSTTPSPMRTLDRPEELTVTRKALTLATAIIGETAGLLSARPAEDERLTPDEI
ncbi:MAG: hypothetical protein JWN86_1679 [Planctomycetota bacterium]|nr:hypothetical protein [Planctomycetota bacterium]